MELLLYDGPMLQKVSDYAPTDPAVSSATDFLDGADENTEYTYDLNGNMTSYLNKGITSITYNHLNLPVEVVYGGDNAVRYSYDASGRRLSAEYGIISWVIDGGGTVEPVNPGTGGGDGLGLLSTEGGGSAGNGASPAAQAPSRVKRVKTFLVRSRRDYCGSCLYADGGLERILTESGWYSPEGSYTATVNDHQGNLRSTLTKSYATPSASTDLVGGSGTAGSGDLAGDLGGAGGTIGSGGVIGIGGTIGGGIVEPQKPRLCYANLTAYSPYGMPLADWQGEERYLYSGKELDRTGGLMLYDFHARQYDPQLGRFTSPDPLQSKYPSLNSYLYCAANPISLTDPTGMYMVGRNLETAQQHVENLQKTIKAITDENKISPVQDYKERVNEMVKSIADVNDAISDNDNEYIVNATNLTDSESGYVENSIVPGESNESGHKTYVVTVENNTDKMAHEFRHVGQIARGELTGYGTSDTNYSLKHEEDAYRAEFGVNGYIDYMPPTDLGDINIFKRLQQSNGDMRIFLKRISRIQEINPETIKEFSDPIGFPIYKNLE